MEELYIRIPWNVMENMLKMLHGKMFHEAIRPDPVRKH